MTYPIIILKVTPVQYSALVNLGNRVASSLAGNLNFADPAVAVTALQAAVTDVVTAIAVWGPKNNRGSHAALVDLKLKALTLHNLLKAEADYCQTTAGIAAGNDYALMASILTTSGFAIKSAGHHQGGLHSVENFKFMASGALNSNQTKMIWDKPLEVTSAGNVKSYNVYRSASTSFAAAIQVDTVSKGEFIDTNTTGAIVTWTYFVAAVGAAGEGAISVGITVTLAA